MIKVRGGAGVGRSASPTPPIKVRIRGNNPTVTCPVEAIRVRFLAPGWMGLSFGAPFDIEL